MDTLDSRNAEAARYFTFREYLARRFKTRVAKIALDAGFTCPNRDGTAGYGGCTFCNNQSFNQAGRLHTGTRPDILEQLELGMQFARRSYGAEKFIAYFQAYTNTYDSLANLKNRYDRALRHPEVVGLAIGTRPDCVGDPVLDLIQSYTARHEVWLELGLQSLNDFTLRTINRGHDSACFLDAVRRARGRGIKIGAHVILGLPGESERVMLNTAQALGGLGIDGLKIHPLHIVERTLMAAQYRRGELRVLAREEFVQLVVDFLEWIPRSVAIQRLTAEAPKNILLAPQWCLRKAELLSLIHQEMERRNFQQGSKLSMHQLN